MGYNLTQINPAYELVSDIVIGTATTTVDFTGLNFDKTDDLMLVSDVKNDQASSSQMYLLVNGNTTITNYYSQALVAASTQPSGFRDNYPSIGVAFLNNKVNVFTNIKLTNNGYFVFQSKYTPYYGTSNIELGLRNGTSTFTLTSITSLRISGGTNTIGAGSRFQLYKRVAPIIADVIVSTATTSVDITGLSIDKGSEYMLVSDINNTSGSGNGYRLSFNNNTTATNYWFQYLYADNVLVLGARTNTNAFASSTAGNKTLSICNIKLTNNGFCLYQSSCAREYGAGIKIDMNYGSSTFTATSITQLTITADNANGIGVGSRFQLIKLR